MSIMGSLQKKIVSVLILIAILVGYGSAIKPVTVSAATKYVTRGDMIQMILDELHETYDEFSLTDYITTAKRIGLINENTFTNYDVYANKEEVAMLLVRADEYLYGKTINSDLVKKIVKCRISDISKVKKKYRNFLAKSYALGYIIGKSNGVYSTDRKFNPKNKVTVAYAKQLVNKIRDKESRHQVSPDGQLIRTTNLPKMAEFYPYILASYPNSYYDWQFMFMTTCIDDTPIYGTEKWLSKKDYASPKDFFDYKNGEKVFYYYYNKNKVSAKELYEECINKWEENARIYLECVFNVDYRTLKNDTKWIEKLISVDFNGAVEKDNTKKVINQYIYAAIKNKTIVESKLIAVDRSTLYISNGLMYLRAYVKYRVVSSNDLSCVMNSPIIFTRFTYPEFKDLQVGEWRDCYVNIDVSSCVPNYGIEFMCINDFLYDSKVVIE